MLTGIHLLGVDDSLDFLLESFCDYFIQKKIVTVEYCDYEKEMQEIHLKLEIPFLKILSSKEYSIVLDLDETLIHYDPLMQNNDFSIRPFAQEFILKISQFYEIIIFTAA